MNHNKNKNKNIKTSPVIHEEENYDENKMKNNAILLKKYIHNIRNGIPLEDEMINDIKHMSHEQKNEIIVSYNAIVASLILYLNDM